MDDVLPNGRALGTPSIPGHSNGFAKTTKMQDAHLKTEAGVLCGSPDRAKLELYSALKLLDNVRRLMLAA